MKEIYILTTVNEEHDVINTMAFNSLLDAQEEMKSEYNREREAFLNDFSEEDLFEDNLFENSAYLAVGDEPLLYYWKINSVVL